MSVWPRVASSTASSGSLGRGGGYDRGPSTRLRAPLARTTLPPDAPAARLPSLMAIPPDDGHRAGAWRRNTLRVKSATPHTAPGVYAAAVTAEDDAIASLRGSGLLDVLTWAAPAAFAATDEIFDEDAGHDQGVVGYLNFKHLRDLIDRATSNGRFVLGDGVGGVGSDVLERGIAPAVFRSMPPVAPDAITRRNYRQSPGWAADGYRVLLQSYTFGRIDKIKWAQRGDAKRRVASQHLIGQRTLFDDAGFGLESTLGIPDDDDFAGVTLVAAHAFNPATKQFELHIGQSKNPEHREDSCWHWRRLVHSGGTSIGGATRVAPLALPGDPASADVDDVVVRIKKKPLAGEGLEVGNE